MGLDVCLTGVSFDESSYASRLLRLKQQDSTVVGLLLGDSETSDGIVLGVHVHLDKFSHEEYNLRGTRPSY